MGADCRLRRGPGSYEARRLRLTSQARLSKEAEKEAKAQAKKEEAREGFQRAKNNVAIETQRKF